MLVSPANDNEETLVPSIRNFATELNTPVSFRSCTCVNSVIMIGVSLASSVQHASKEPLPSPAFREQ